jgi:hypothetical protein
LDHIVVGSNQFIKGTTGFFKKRAFSGELRLLPQQSNSGAGMPANVAIVRTIQVRKEAQQRGLAGSVGSNQPDSFARVKLEANVLEQGISVKPATKAGATQQDHVNK